MGYVVDDRFVRVDIWKNNGRKWQANVSLYWRDYTSRTPIHELFRQYMEEQYPQYCQAGYRATCLEPEHQYQHPLCITFGEV